MKREVSWPQVKSKEWFNKNDKCFISGRTRLSWTGCQNKHHLITKHTETYKSKLNFDRYNVCDSEIGDENLLVSKRKKILPQSQIF